MKTINEINTELPSAGLGGIASIVRQDWKKVNFAAKPYLNAMGTMDSINSYYGADTGKSIVAYFLANAGTWRGEVARAVKKELNKRLNA